MNTAAVCVCDDDDLALTVLNERNFLLLHVLCRLRLVLQQKQTGVCYQRHYIVETGHSDHVE